MSDNNNKKRASLDFPFAPPLITITSNFDDITAESDAEITCGASKKRLSGVVVPTSHIDTSDGRLSLGVPPSHGGMCYLSPFSMGTMRNDRAPSESNLSSSGYSSMASPGPSRCGSNNPLFPCEIDDAGTG